MLRVVIIKPSKYGVTGYVERFRRGFMPNSTVPYIRSMTPDSIDGVQIETRAIDEYVQTDLGYLDLLKKPGVPTLLALVGVQSHQFQRSIDVAAFALANGVRHCVIGGPHPMTCDTSMLHNRGVSFALAEAEVVWPQILKDAIHGELQPVYGANRRWARELDAPVVIPPSKRDLQRYVVPMLGIYPARGCPFTCTFCSVIKIAGRRIRSQSIETTMRSLRAAKAANIRQVMFTSDNFNKYADAPALLEQMIAERIGIPFFAQCDTQVAKQEDFVALLGRAGCFQMFVGVESFNRKTLLKVHKAQNYPDKYGDIVRLCRKYRIATHFSNIIGFPEDTVTGIRDHVRILKELAPDIASFYVLTPIPGTQQYDEFRAAGWITESNLDRYDGTNMTWRHDTIASDQIRALLFECYRKFYDLRQIAARVVSSWQAGRNFNGIATNVGVPFFSRLCVARKMHPMSGGISRVALDSLQDYITFRERLFGLRLVPLPNSLELSRADSELNNSLVPSSA